MRNETPKIETRRGKSRTGRGTPVPALLATLGILLSACAPRAGSETMIQIGAELNEVMPTVSVEDTEQTIEENATFREVFFAIFPGLAP